MGYGWLYMVMIHNVLCNGYILLYGMLGSSWHWNSPRFYLRQENSPMNGALTTLKWMLMIIQLFTMAHLFLDGFPGLPIKFSSSPWAPKTWARIHLLWPVQVGSTHFFTWHRKISQVHSHIENVRNWFNALEFWQRNGSHWHCSWNRKSIVAHVVDPWTWAPVAMICVGIGSAIRTDLQS